MAENSGSKRDSDGPSKQDLIASGKATNDPVSLLKPTAPPVGLRLLHTLTGHTGWVNSVVWSPDGKWLASEDDSKTVQVWDSSTGRLVQTLVGHTDGIYQPVWSPEGKWLVTSPKDKTAR
ncbi:MAG: PD40 domain-containing protein, partial [Ktedonobacteraceae bacterium]|nr:PD40 domain-containing protein [Ktedonobacteraceae bacterium]